MKNLTLGRCLVSLFSKKGMVYTSINRVEVFIVALSMYHQANPALKAIMYIHDQIVIQASKSKKRHECTYMHTFIKKHAAIMTSKSKLGYNQVLGISVITVICPVNQASITLFIQTEAEPSRVVCLTPAQSKSRSSSIIRQLLYKPDTQDHNEQTNRNDNEEPKPKPTKHHSRGPDTALHAAVAHVLGDRTGRDGGGVLP